PSTVRMDLPAPALRLPARLPDRNVHPHAAEPQRERRARMTLREVIAEEIRAHGPIPFSHYMELCLYHPALGYYSRAQEKFGKAGDFYTASDVHAIYGRLM